MVFISPQKLFSFSRYLKVVSATYLLVCFVYLKENTFETRRNAFYFASKALLVLGDNQILTF